MTQRRNVRWIAGAALAVLTLVITGGTVSAQRTAESGEIAVLRYFKIKKGAYPASVDHWRATRNEVLDTYCDGAELTNMRDSLKRRADLTIEGNVTVLSGTLAANGPYLHVPPVRK